MRARPTASIWCAATQRARALRRAFLQTREGLVHEVERRT